MKKVVSEISGVVFSLPWLVAKDEGLFEAEGIDMEFVKSPQQRRSCQRHTENHSKRLTPSWGIRLSRRAKSQSTGLERKARSVGPMKATRAPSIIALRSAVASQAILVNVRTRPITTRAP